MKLTGTVHLEFSETDIKQLLVERIRAECGIAIPTSRVQAVYDGEYDLSTFSGFNVVLTVDEVKNMKV